MCVARRALRLVLTLVLRVRAGNGIGDEGAKTVAEALQTNRTLTTLGLGCAWRGGPYGSF